MIEGDRFKMFDVTEDGVESEPFVDEIFTVGQRGGAAVIVLADGVVLSQNATGDLVYEDEVYPRLP